MRKWKKIGKFQDIFRSKYGQFIGRQFFKNPLTSRKEEYIFHGEGEGVRIFALTQDKKVVVIKEYQHAVDEIILQLPTGGLKKGETHFLAAKRELLEETGYGFRKMIYLGESYSLSRSCPTKEYSFLAMECRKIKDQKLDSSEQIQILEMSLSGWVDLINKGKIKQDVSVSATFRALVRLKLLSLRV
jgi:ADP-ribose pyrophosphatase